jgi:hypothetical protein
MMIMMMMKKLQFKLGTEQIIEIYICRNITTQRQQQREAQLSECSKKKNRSTSPQQPHHTHLTAAKALSHSFLQYLIHILIYNSSNTS